MGAAAGLWRMPVIRVASTLTIKRLRFGQGLNGCIGAVSCLTASWLRRRDSGRSAALRTCTATRTESAQVDLGHARMADFADVLRGKLFDSDLSSVKKLNLRTASCLSPSPASPLDRCWSVAERFAIHEQ